ncbi:hypothetical protein [Longirhabdus pacifica]|uniref:hypothetical protein n=1 Tax=Longirhabdus pacifica TaxID=2305227 RepID=UPI0010087FEF|nr:hypothetical protein [Longirhabdus pacifica]
MMRIKTLFLVLMFMLVMFTHTSTTISLNDTYYTALSSNEKHEQIVKPKTSSAVLMEISETINDEERKTIMDKYNLENPTTDEKKFWITNLKNADFGTSLQWSDLQQLLLSLTQPLFFIVWKVVHLLYGHGIVYNFVTK